MIGKYKIIALMTCRIHNMECYTFIDILNKRLSGTDYRLFVYNCSPRLDEDIKENDPQTSVYEMFGVPFTDAVIIDSAQIGNTAVCEKIIDRAHKMDLPVISLGESFEGCINIIYEHHRSIEDIVAHLSDIHGISDFHMIAGTKGNSFSEKRIEAFKKALQKRDIPFNDDMVSYGDFWSEPAAAAAEKLLNEGRLPRAFVCANDHMAIAVSVFLQSKGISVPEDVAVTGYDCIDTVFSSSPTITSACIKKESIAETICGILDRVFEGEDTENIIKVYPEPVFNESCGCKASRRLDAALLFNEQTNMFNRFQNENIILSETAARIQKGGSFEDIAYIMNEYDLMYSMCCIIKQEYTDESVNPELESVCGSEGGLFVLYDSDVIGGTKRSDEAFKPYYMHEREIIPNLMKYLDGGRCCIFTTLHYLGITLGYICFHFNGFSAGNYYKVPQTSGVLNNALGGFLSQRYKRYLMKRIERISGTDMLTGLYNRRGFCMEYDRLLENLKNERLAVIMCDLDGLKYINDTFGHEEGDNAIHTAASALKNVCPESAICTRFGGDEMIAVFPYNEDGTDVRTLICEYLDRYNESSGKPYSVAASIGIYITASGEKPDFEELVKKSDALMYEEKKRRKAACTT
ncbi:MAG: GGDEF domain-containing protein [Oscillospiraceae bacterium]|nr:GGDEF domain-containing protein [Oscillospiraceae bacterium]